MVYLPSFSIARRWLFFGVASLLVAALALVALPLGGSQRAEAQSTIEIEIGNFWFCDSSAHVDPTGQICTVTIDVGDSVRWVNNSILTHTATNCADNFATCSPPREWDTGLVLAAGNATAGPFNTPGTFIYRCQIHTLSSNLMRATLIVQETVVPGPVGGVADFPDEGLSAAQAADSSAGSSSLPYAAMAAAAAAVVALAAGGWYVGKRFRRWRIRL